MAERRQVGPLRPEIDPGHSERGAGTVLMAGLAMVALLLVGALVLMLQATTAASRAATAADLGALAAADVARGLAAGDPCTAARLVAEYHGGSLDSCDVGGTGPGTVIVRVSVGVPGPLPDATGSARAGPPG